ARVAGPAGTGGPPRRRGSAASAGAEGGGAVDLRNGVSTSGPRARSSEPSRPSGSPTRPRPLTRWPTGPSLASFGIWLDLHTLGGATALGVVPKPDAGGPDDPVSTTRQPRGRHVQCTPKSGHGVGELPFGTRNRSAVGSGGAVVEVASL